MRSGSLDDATVETGIELDRRIFRVLKVTLSDSYNMGPISAL